MKVLVLGGTGSIGAPVVRELLRHGHDVCALARSDSSADRLTGWGARTVRGDLLDPGGWLAALPPCDGVIHVAEIWEGDPRSVHAHFLDRLLRVAASWPRLPRVVLTGGCWLYGPTAPGALTTEDSPFHPLSEFAWFLPLMDGVLASTACLPLIVHPAMVYEDDAGGVLRRFREEARRGGPVRVAGREAVQWPLVHHEDLARLYRLVLERGSPGSSYLGSAVDGVEVGALARAVATRYGAPGVTVQVISADTLAAEVGEWARGEALSQRQSGARARRELGWAPAHCDPLAELSRH